MAGWLAPKEPIPRAVYLTASAATVVALAAGWALLAYGGLVRPEFLPAPHHVLQTAVELAADGTLWTHVRASCFVILTGFALASVLAVPLGISRPRFSWMWLLPIVLWVSPRSENGALLETFVPGIVVTVLVVVLLARPSPRDERVVLVPA